MKRILATSLVACMVVGCMAGCGKGDTQIDDGVNSTSTVTSNETAEQVGDTNNTQVSDKKSERYDGKMLLTVRNQDVYKHLELSNENRYLGDVIDFARSSIDVENYPAILHSEQAGAVEAFRMLDLAETDLKAYAIGMTPMTDRAYGVMILKPVDGVAKDKVKESLIALKEDTAELFKDNMPDQYDIAKSAIIGELGDYIYFVMTNDYKAVVDTVKLALGNQDELNNYIEINVEEYDVLDKFIGDVQGEQASTDVVDNKESNDTADNKADDSTDTGTKDVKADVTNEMVVGGIEGSDGDVVVDSGVQSDGNVADRSNNTLASSNDTSSDWE